MEDRKRVEPRSAAKKGGGGGGRGVQEGSPRFPANIGGDLRYLCVFIIMDLPGLFAVGIPKGFN